MSIASDIEYRWIRFTYYRPGWSYGPYGRLLVVGTRRKRPQYIYSAYPDGVLGWFANGDRIACVKKSELLVAELAYPELLTPPDPPIYMVVELIRQATYT